MMKMVIDVRSETSVYITINRWVYCIDDSTDEQIVQRWLDRSFLDWNPSKESIAEEDIVEVIPANKKMKPHNHRSDGILGTRAFAGCVALPGRCRPVTHGNGTYVLRCTCGATKLMNQNADTKEHGPWVEKHREGKGE